MTINFDFNKNLLSLLTFASVVFSIAPLSPACAQETPTLKGFVNAQDVVKTKSNPSLDRRSLPTHGDEFSQPSAGPGMELFDAPSAAFDNQRAFAPPPPTFGLNASHDGDAFQGYQQTPVQAPPPPIHSGLAPQNMLPAMNAGASDPDSTEQMQLQWDLWHKRVAEAIFVRFDEKAKSAFANSRPISCEASYSVTRDGRITNVRLLRKSNDMSYNMMLMMVLNSMSGNPLLQFPPGSHRQFVCKTGEFSRNCGMNGFRHTINDNERISGMRGGMPH